MEEVMHHLENYDKPKVPFRIVIPGIRGEANEMTALRKDLHGRFGENVAVLSSLVGFQGVALKKGERSLHDYYRNRAREITTHAQQRDLQIFAHSLGTSEALDLTHAIVAFPEKIGKNIDISLMAYPSENGFTGVRNLLRNYSLVSHDMPVYEQHTAFPLPEDYYSHSVHQPDDSLPATVIPDTEEDRDVRRINFNIALFQLIPDSQRRVEFGAEISQIDSDIKLALKEGRPFNEQLIRRQELLSPLIEQLFHGEQFPSGVTQEYMKQYRELKADIAPLGRYAAVALLGLGRFMQRIYTGIDREYMKLLADCDKKGVNLQISIVGFERDKVLSSDKFPKILEQYKAHGDEDKIKKLLLVEQAAHSSFGYNPEYLHKVMQAVGTPG